MMCMRRGRESKESQNGCESNTRQIPYIVLQTCLQVGV